MMLEIDTFHSLVEFSVQHLKVSVVKGRFTEVHGTIDMNSQQPERSIVKAEIMTNSIHTGAAQRDAHLRSADFFETTKYPMITFESTKIQLINQGQCTMNGNLSLHGVTQPVSMQVKYIGQSQDPLTDAWRLGLCAMTKIDRRQFGITFNQQKAGTLLIGNEIRIDLSIEAIVMS